MGCGSSLADRAIGLDGHDNVKEYVIEKNKQLFIENYITQIYKNTSGNIKRLKLKKINEIEQDENNAKNFVQQVKAQIEKRQPGSISKAQALHKTPADQLLGLKETLQKLEHQKVIVNERYQQQQKEILKEIREQYKKIYDSINPSTSKLAHINGLPEAERLRAFKWGDQYAQKQIEIHNRTLKEQLDKNIVLMALRPPKLYKTFSKKDVKEPPEPASRTTDAPPVDSKCIPVDNVSFIFHKQYKQYSHRVITYLLR